MDRIQNLQELLSRPARPTSFGRRAAAILSERDEIAFGAVSFGDIVYDRINIDSAVLQAFDFTHTPSAGDIYELATWSQGIVEGPSGILEGNLNRLQGYVFERLAALSLRQSGAVVELADSPTNPGWDLSVNGVPFQAKCGISPKSVTEHLQKYPDVPHVVVNEDLASHFLGNDYVIAIPGTTRDSVRAMTEHSLDSAADMLDLHLAHAIPAISIARNAYALWRGDTDLRALPGNVAADAAGRILGAGAGHVAGGVIALGLGGWPAILAPVIAVTAGYRGGRAISNGIKRHLLLRNEYATLSCCMLTWCQGAAGVLSNMIHRAERIHESISAARERAHPEFRPLFDDWQKRLAAEQSFRQLHLGRFARGGWDVAVFDDGQGPLHTCAAAMVAASRAGILPANLIGEKNSLTAALDGYRKGLRRFLLRH